MEVLTVPVAADDMDEPPLQPTAIPATTKIPMRQKRNWASSRGRKIEEQFMNISWKKKREFFKNKLVTDHVLKTCRTRTL